MQAEATTESSQVCSQGAEAGQQQQRRGQTFSNESPRLLSDREEMEKEDTTRRQLSVSQVVLQAGTP
jgi:hypothetical protein